MKLKKFIARYFDSDGVPLVLYDEDDARYFRGDSRYCLSQLKECKRNYADHEVITVSVENGMDREMHAVATLVIQTKGWDHDI